MIEITLTFILTSCIMFGIVLIYTLIYAFSSSIKHFKHNKVKKEIVKFLKDNKIKKGSKIITSYKKDYIVSNIEFRNEDNEFLKCKISLKGKHYSNSWIIYNIDDCMDLDIERVINHDEEELE